MRDDTQGKTPTRFIVDWQAIARVMKEQGGGAIVHMSSVNGVLANKAALTSDEARNKILGHTPMKRLVNPSELARVVDFLARDAAIYITGEVITVDGGRMALNDTVKI